MIFAKTTQISDFFPLPHLRKMGKFAAFIECPKPKCFSFRGTFPLTSHQGFCLRPPLQTRTTALVMGLCPFSRNSLLKYVAARNRKKITKTPYFGGSRSFKVVNVDTNKKLVTSTCYDRQHICTYLQPCLRYTR